MQQRHTFSPIHEDPSTLGDPEGTRRARYDTETRVGRLDEDESRVTARPPALPAAGPKLPPRTMEVSLDELYSDENGLSDADELLYLASSAIDLDIEDMDNPALRPQLPSLPGVPAAPKSEPPPALPFPLRRKHFAGAPAVERSDVAIKTLCPEEALLASLPASARAVLEQARAPQPAWPHSARIAGAVARPILAPRLG